MTEKIIDRQQCRKQKGGMPLGDSIEFSQSLQHNTINSHPCESGGQRSLPHKFCTQGSVLFFYDMNFNHQFMNIRMNRIPAPLQQKPSFPSPSTAITRNTRNIHKRNVTLEIELDSIDPAKASFNTIPERESLSEAIARLRSSLNFEKLFLSNRSRERLARKHQKDRLDFNLLSSDDIQSILKFSHAKDILELCTTSRESALGLQSAIENLEPSILARLEEVLRPEVASLIVHQQGSYAVQRLVAKSRTFQCTVADYCIEEMRVLIRNYYSSKVIQCIIENSGPFCEAVLDYFRQDPSELWSDISAVFIVCTAIRMSPCQSHYEFILDTIARKEARIGSRYLKRILVAVVENCNQKDLPSIYSLLNGCYTFFQKGRDRFLAQILETFIKRGTNDPSEGLLFQIIHQPSKLFESKCFTTMIYQLAENDTLKIKPALHKAFIDCKRRGFLDHCGPTTAQFISYLIFRTKYTLCSSIQTLPDSKSSPREDCLYEDSF